MRYIAREQSRPPEFPEFPCQHARLLDTGGPPIPGRFRIVVSPSATIKTPAPTESHFGALSPWPTSSLSTLNPQRHHWRPKTRFRVATNLARVGLAPTGNQRTVSVNKPPCRLTSSAPELRSAHNGTDLSSQHFTSVTQSLPCLFSGFLQPL